MEYRDLVDQHCPAAVQKSVAAAGKELDDETALFSEISSVPLSPSCAYGVIGELSDRTAPERTDTFKVNYLLLAIRHAPVVTRYGDAADQARIRQQVAAALGGIIDDITKSNLQGSILAALMAYRIDLRPDIDQRVDYKGLAMKRLMANWIFNEYATCMGDPDGPGRLAQLLAAAAPQDLRNIFSDMWAKYVRGEYLMPKDVIAELARPYLGDARPTVEIHGDGPPVSHYARELVNAL